MNGTYQKYHRLAQEAYYSNLEIVPENIFERYPGYDIDLYFYYGFLQPTSTEHFQKLAMFFMKNFNPKYFSTNADPTDLILLYSSTMQQNLHQYTAILEISFSC